MVHWWILGACLSNQRRKPHDTEDVDNGHLKECREFDILVDLHCNTFKIRFRAVYTQAYGGACRRDRTRKTHGCQTRTPSTFFFWSEKKGGSSAPSEPPLATCLHTERRRRMCTVLTIFLGFYLLSYLVCYNVKLHVIVVTLAVRSPPSSSVTWLAEVSKFSSHACSIARTHLERSKTARRKENSEAANLADFGLCCCNA